LPLTTGHASEASEVEHKSLVFGLLGYKVCMEFCNICGKEEAISTVEPIARGEPKLAHKVVVELSRDIEGKGHVIAMDNFFTSIGLFKELAEKAIYATGTLRSNCIGIPSALKNTKAFSRVPQGTLDWRMHESRSMSSVLWKNKKLVLLLSMSAIPIGFPYVPVDTVPVDMVSRRNGAEREAIPTSSMHVEYTTHMRGVDIADQLRASYNTQNRSHKWWHRIFFFLLDITVVNMFIMYVAACKTSFAHPRKPMTHLQFRTQLCEALLKNWKGRGATTVPPPTTGTGVCFPVQTRL
jgi:hypothetical protein